MPCGDVLKLEALKWFHVCVVYDEKKFIKIYINSKLHGELEDAQIEANALWTICNVHPKVKDSLGDRSHRLLSRVADFCVFESPLTTAQLEEVYMERNSSSSHLPSSEEACEADNAEFLSHLEKWTKVAEENFGKGPLTVEDASEYLSALFEIVACLQINEKCASSQMINYL